MSELDAKIREDLNDDCAIPCAGSDHVAYVNYLVTVDALRAVLDVHFPIGPDGDEECHACMTDFHTPYPCKTVKAIADALGVSL